MLAFDFQDQIDTGVEAGLGAALALSPGDEAGLGLVVTPFGTLTFEQEVVGWAIRMDATAGMPSFAINNQRACAAGRHPD